jgi:type IV pilus assembly protein PilO
LQERHPGLWPILPRLLLLLAFTLLLIAAGAWLLWMDQWEQLEKGQAEEEKIRQEFIDKIRQSQNLDLLRKRKVAVLAQVEKLEKQLPGKAEMDALLSEINQAGVGRGLQFELFKPGQLQLTEHYAELPIAIKLTGNYHALAGFVSDIANLPRIVTIDNLSISRQKDGQIFEAIVHTYRYLDKAEVEAQKKHQEDLQKGKKR